MEKLMGMSRPRYLVAQVGSRRWYSVPVALERHGLLSFFYTDLCIKSHTMEELCRLAATLGIGAARRLQGRRIPNSIKEKTKTFFRAAIHYEIAKHQARGDMSKLANALRAFGESLGSQMVEAGFKGATHLYTLSGDVAPLLRAARSKGITTITEIYVLPSADLIVAEEKVRYPGYEEPVSGTVADAAIIWIRDIIRLSDWFVVPSDAVREDLTGNFGVSRARCLVVPYAASDRFYKIQNFPTEKRVLFVGTAGMRKGIHILGKAADLLAGRGYIFRVAGDVSNKIAKHPETQRLEFLGRVPRLDIENEYRCADIFVLPSLAEGSAEVTYEALATGIPVIATREAGSVLRDGVDGVLIPRSDPVALAQAIEKIATDRELRRRMSKSARKRAREYTLEKYGERLAASLRSASPTD